MNIRLQDMIDRRVIDVREQGATDDFVDSLTKSETANISKVFLAKNNITFAGVKFFSRANWSNLAYLSFISNHIRDKGCKYLTKIPLPMLTLVALDSNQIGDAGMLHLSKAQWISLKEGFSMHQNKLQHGSVRFFANANLMNCRRLDLSKNNMKREELFSLILIESKTISFLDIGWNVPFEQKPIVEKSIKDKFLSRNQPSFCYFF